MSEPLSPAPTPEPAAAPSVKAPPAGHELLLAWGRANPVPAALLGAMVLTLAFFYAGVPLFYVPAKHASNTFARWIWEAWNPETHYEHGPLVPLIILFLIWNDLPKLRSLALRPSLWGLAPFVLGVLMYLVGVRALQPRFGWAGLPFILWGGVLFAAGWQWLRALFFPILCVFFLIPVPGIDQATVKLQVIATNAANVVCNLIGIKMKAVGTTLIAQDDSFQFQVIGDCSGINSLMAITLMTAVFAYLTQDRLWKMFLLFLASAPVAIIGNIARLTSIMLVAKCFGQAVAGGWFHEISAYVVSFPFAFATLCLVNKLLNWGNEPLVARRPSGEEPSGLPAGTRPLAVASGARAANGNPTYDY